MRKAGSIISPMALARMTAMAMVTANLMMRRDPVSSMGRAIYSHL